MVQLELANVPVKEWIIDPDVHGLFYCPSDVVHLPTHYGEVVHIDVMTRYDRGNRWVKGPEVFLEPFPKSSFKLLYACLIAIQFVTLVPVHNPTFLCDVFPILGDH